MNEDGDNADGVVICNLYHVFCSEEVVSVILADHQCLKAAV